MCRVTRTTPLSGMVGRLKANTWYSLQSHKIWSLQLQSPFGDIPGGLKLCNWSRDPDHAPFRDDLIIGRLGHAMINLSTKCEVSSFSHYEDMKCVKNAQNGGWFGVVRDHSRSWAMSSFDRAHTISYSSLTETIRGLCGPICSHLDTILACSGRTETHRQTHDDTTDNKSTQSQTPLLKQ